MFNVSDIEITNNRIYKEPKGKLGFLESNIDLPFNIERIFFINNVPAHTSRGNHAHKLMSEYLISLNGKINVFCNDGKNEKSFILDSSDIGLLIPPTIWTKQIYLEPNSNLVAISDRKYEEEDYIRSFDEFLKFRSEV